MNRSAAMATAAAFAALLALGAPAGAEEAPMKVTSVLHPDGSRTETITNPAEKTAEERVVNAAGKQMKRTVYTLDDYAQPNGGVVYSADNRPISRFQLIRDTSGNITEQRDYTVSGEVYQRRIFRTNTQGRVVGVDTYDGRGQLVHTTGSGNASQARRQAVSQPQQQQFQQQQQQQQQRARNPRHR